MSRGVGANETAPVRTKGRFVRASMSGYAFEQVPPVSAPLVDTSVVRVQVTLLIVAEKVTFVPLSTAVAFGSSFVRLDPCNA